MNMRAFKAIFLNAFGRRGNGGAKASRTTFVLSLIFVIALFLVASNFIASGWLKKYNNRYLNRRIVVVNAPESFTNYLYSAHQGLMNRIIYKNSDAPYDFTEYSDLMEKNGAFMTIYFPTDFDEATEQWQSREILSYILSDKLYYSEMHNAFRDEVLKGYQDHLKIISGVTIGKHDDYGIKYNPVNVKGRSGLNYSIEYFARSVIPLVTFIVILYAGMSKGTNSIAGQKEKGILTSVMLTPVSPHVIVAGNLCGIWLYSSIPALAGVPLLLLFRQFRSVTSILSGIILIMTLALLVSAVTLMISVMNDTVVSAQTAFLPVFFILLGVCILCIRNVDDVESFYYRLPVYGHFYGLGRLITDGGVTFFDIILCAVATICLSVICILITAILFRNERYTTTVESYSDKQANKYRRAAERYKIKSTRPPKATVFGYVPNKYRKSRKLIFHHIRFPLIVLSLTQVMALIPALIEMSRTRDFSDVMIRIKNLTDLENMITSIFGIFSILMSTPVFILFMGIGYSSLVAIYVLKVRFFDKNSPATLGFRTWRRGFNDYIKGLLYGFLMISMVFILLIVTGKAKITGFGIPSGYGFLFAVYIFMWLPQGMSEEVMFRGYMMPRIASRFGTVFAVFFSSLMFGVFHAANIGFSVLALINLVLIAVAYALICLYTESIVMTCAMHSVWNFCQGNIFGMHVSGTESAASLIHTKYAAGVSPVWTGGEFGPEGGLFVTFVSLIVIGAVGFLLYRRRKAS